MAVLIHTGIKVILVCVCEDENSVRPFQVCLIRMGDP